VFLIVELLELFENHFETSHAGLQGKSVVLVDYVVLVRLLVPVVAKDHEVVVRSYFVLLLPYVLEISNEPN